MPTQYSHMHCGGIKDLTESICGREIGNWGSAPPFLPIKKKSQTLDFDGEFPSPLIEFNSL